MIDLRKHSGWTAIRRNGPVTLFHHRSGKYVTVTRSLSQAIGSRDTWQHQGREVTLTQLVTRKKLVTLATAESHYEAELVRLGLVNREVSHV